MSEALTPEQFEHRVAAMPDLELSPFYWNNLLPETAPYYFLWLLVKALDIKTPCQISRSDN